MLEARREENEAVQQQSGRGGRSEAIQVTGQSDCDAWHADCLGAGATAPLLSASGGRESEASPRAVVAGGWLYCKASDRASLARSCSAGNQMGRVAGGPHPQWGRKTPQ